MDLLDNTHMGTLAIVTPAEPVVAPEIDDPELEAEINLDYAATTPALQPAVEAVLRALPAYGSVHRGGGVRSRRTTDAYETARASVAAFVDAGPNHVVVFVRNTTEAINLVAATLPQPSRVLCTPLEHHANLLPWRTHHTHYLPFVGSADELVERTEEALSAAAEARKPFDVLAVCGASNVTGEVLPVARLAAAAARTDTRVLVDAAQLAPHRRISVRQLGVDFLALSGHKLYAPFGTGALVVRRDLLQSVPPLLKGGGAVRAVTLDDVVWAELPQRLEAGTPNVLGAIALAGACDALARHGLERIGRQEAELAERLWTGLESIEGCRVLRSWPDHGDRVGVATFVIDGLEPRDIGARLAREHGIAVRSGLFCAHPYVSHLLRTCPETTAAAIARARRGEDAVLPGAVRASLGIGVTAEHVDRLIAGVRALADQMA